MAGFALGETARSAGYRLAGFERVGSTNAEALAAAAAGDPGGIWFAAIEQSEGRGRRGRHWVSPRGNLAATLLIVPDAAPEAVPTLGFVAGVALGRALEGITRARIALKWPNDVLAEGAKLAGILLEAHRRPDGRHAVAIGLGVNVVAAPQDLPYAATSLSALGSDCDAPTLLAALSDAWVPAFALWDEGRGISAVLAEWRARAAGIGAEIAVQRDGETVRGLFETIDERGRLIVRAPGDRRIAVAAGDVHFGATASARS